MDKHTPSLEFSHLPVMLDEVIKISSPIKGGTFIDCTFGGGGYSKELLRFSKTKVKGLDRDNKVKEIAQRKQMSSRMIPGSVRNDAASQLLSSFSSEIDEYAQELKKKSA